MNAPVLSPGTMKTLVKVFGSYPELTQVILFGSRATGKSSPRSDIDIATKGIEDSRRLGRLALDLEDTNIPQKCDLQAYEAITYAALKTHIDSVGIIIYRKTTHLE